MTIGTRIIRAPRGLRISCKGWQQEAALRMLMNNLDPDVAERPDDLVVYGGSGKAARNWEAFDAIVASLRALENDETLLVQSGKPVGVFPHARRRAARAHRQLAAGARLGHLGDVPRPRGRGLTMYGQMTAGSWIYIGTQGILQGTYETFAAAAKRHFGGTLARPRRRDRRSRRHGRRPAAGRDDERRGRAGRRGRSRSGSSGGWPRGYLDEATDSLDEALARVDEWRRDRRRAIDRPSKATRRTCCPNWCGATSFLTC